MSYLGFTKLQSKIEAEGKSPAAAAGIAASIGRAKYGKKKFQKAATSGTSLRKAAATGVMKK